MKAHKLFGSSRLVLTILLLVGGLTASAVTYADSIFTPLNSVFEGSFLSGFSRSGPTTPNAQIVSEPSVTTDQGEYAPGQIVQISGSGFAPNELVTLQIVHVDTNSFALKDEFSLNSYDHHGHDPWQVMVGADGTFASSWLVEDNSYGKTLLLTADQPATETHGALHAEVTFLDAIGFNKGVYNKDDFPPDSTGDWTTGNAGSHYEEGQWVYYQYQVAGIGAGNPTPDFDIKFNHYQSNVNAIFIDAFANFRACVDCEEDSFTSGPKEGMLLDDVPYPSTDTTNWKSAISAISFINGTLNASGQCVAAEDPVNTPSQEHCFKVSGSALQALFPLTNFSSGNHTITLFYEAHLSNTRTWKNGKQSLIGCPTSIHYANPGPEVVPADTVYGTEAYSGGDPCVEGEAGDWNGVFNGVGFATGSSRHFNIINQTAGSQGQLSLPIPTVEAPTGSITIVKVTQPSPATGATFGFSGDLGPFNLDTDPATAGTSHTITFNDIPANIPFSVTESSMPTDWALTTIVCTVTSGGSQVTSVPTATATVTLPSTDGASATCTFTNRNDNLLNGRIIVVKQTTPDGDPQEFTFTPSYNGGTQFMLSDGESNDSCEGGPNCLPQGLYSVAETVPDDWVLTSASCSDGSPVNAIDLGEGETVTCTFNNTKLTADIEVTKTVDEDEICSGSTTQVTYTYQVSNNGTAALPTVTVVDDNGTPGDTGDDFSPTFQSGDDGDGVLEPGETWVYSASKNVSGTTTNTVTATGTTAGGQQDSDTASATVTAFNCTIDVTKSADAETICSGTSTTYDFSITNNSTKFTWTGTFSDDVVGDIGAQPLVLAP
ncbi:MAG TPA: hypothetical protein VFZ49_07810, partial [Pyrinomonadaceae bacterium]